MDSENFERDVLKNGKAEKRYVVPEGMLEFGYDAWMIYGDYPAHDPARRKVVEQMLERMIKWQGEHPQKATEKFAKEMIDECQFLPAALGYHRALIAFAIIVAEKWQRRAYLAPETQVPEAVKDLLFSSGDGEADHRILEAYRRGLENQVERKTG